MHEIVSFGCSFTWGYGLDDTSPRTNLIPSAKAWPSVLASDLGYSLDNTAIPGNSNKDIWWEIINYEFHPANYVFVLWTFIDRFSIINENKSTTTISPKSKNSKEYYKKFYNNYDALVDLNLRMHHVWMHLNSIKIPQHHMLIDNKNFVQESWNKIILQKTNFSSIMLGKNKVFGHPNEKEHSIFAKQIKKELK